MPRFRVLTTKATTISTGLGGYNAEMEALEPLDAEIVECEASEAAFVALAPTADAVYAKGMRFTAPMIAAGSSELSRISALGLNS